MKKYYNIDFFRFVFAAVIVYFHILSNIKSSVGEMYWEQYRRLREMCKDSALLVEGFLVIAGFFLYTSTLKHMNKGFIEIVLDKVVRLWPVFFFYTAISVIKYKTPMEMALLDLFFFRATGISMSNVGIIWYIGPFFWCTLLIMALLRLDERKGLLIVSVIGYLGYAMNLNTYNGGLGRNIEYGFVSMAMFRVFSGMAVGCLLAAGIKAFGERFDKSSDENSMIKTAVFTIIETTVIYVLFKAMLFDKSIINNGITAVILFAALVFCMVKGYGLWARILNMKIFGLLGRYSYSIYIMQQISFYIMKASFWKNTEFLNENVMLTMLLSTAFAILVGVVTYHLVEAPAVKIYNKWKNSKEMKVRE